MPVRPENRDLYPDDWDELSRAVKEDAGWRCECRGECGRPRGHLERDGRCGNEHGQPAYGTGSRVVLTTAHLNHWPPDVRRENLRAMCQGCHLHYDAPHHAETAARTRYLAETEGMTPLF